MRRSRRPSGLALVLGAVLVAGLVPAAGPVAAGGPVRDPLVRAERGAPVGPIHRAETPVVAQGPQTGTVDVRSASWWIDAFDYLWVVGEVYNGTAQRRTYISIDVAVNDGSGTLVGSTSAYADIDELAPGMVSPFAALMDAPPGAATVLVGNDGGDPVDGRPGGPLQVSMGVPYVDGIDYRHYPGTLTNKSAFPIEFARVHITLYDAAGEVLNTEFDYTSLDVIPAGGSSTFDVAFGEFYTDATRIEVVAQGRDIDDFGRLATTWNNYFDDIGFSPFRSDILWNAERGITTGCGTALFCPLATVPRDQMASFLSRALGLGGGAPDAFTDDNGNVHEPNINLVAEAGIASGCGGGKFCPASQVARDQMASFLARALALSGPAPNAFTDDTGNIHEPNINLVAREGIATGCGGTNYCPTQLVTRGQMAAFLRRAFD